MQKTTSNIRPGHSKWSSILFNIGAILTVTAWGVSFVSTKVLLDNGLSSVEIYILRFIFAYLIVLTFSHDKLWADTWGDELRLMLCGLLAGSIYFIAENTALEYTKVAFVALITALAPLLTTILVGILYKSERPTTGTWIGSVIAFLGVGFVIFNGGGDSSATTSWSDNIIGDLLALASALSWCVYSVILRRLNVIYTTNFITRKTFFYGVLTAIPFLAAEPHITPFSALLKPDVWGNLLFLVLGASILAFFFWAIAVKRLGAVKASNYLYMSPIVSLIAAWIILGEKITFMGYLGCAFIIGGLMLGDYLSTHPLRTIRWRH